MDIPQEYWFSQTLFEIEIGVDTPLLVDDATKKKAFVHYARILIDILFKRIFNEMRVGREGFEFYVDKYIN
jgi:hypothetical protein